jgi:hypothetical protein
LELSPVSGVEGLVREDGPSPPVGTCLGGAGDASGGAGPSDDASDDAWGAIWSVAEELGGVFEVHAEIGVCPQEGRWQDLGDAPVGEACELAAVEEEGAAAAAEVDDDAADGDLAHVAGAGGAREAPDIVGAELGQKGPLDPAELDEDTLLGGGVEEAPTTSAAHGLQEGTAADLEGL